MMTLLDARQLRQALDVTRSDLFRWESLPAYEVASDGSDYGRYLDGAPEPTWARKQPWLDILRTWAQQGRARRRVRYIHDPITDYERYSAEWGYALNAPAGEQIRVLDAATVPLPRELVDLPDFWLIDGRDVVVMHYRPDGQFRGAQLLDAQHGEQCRLAATVAWRLGRDFESWWGQHPEHHRSAHRAA